MADVYDVIIIGAGAAGENVAGRTSPGGLSTVIIEEELGGRRMLLLGLYALQGVAAAPRGLERREARAKRPPVP